MKLVAEEYTHRNPWYCCFGCWKIITLALLYAAVCGLWIRSFLE
jgi:hypothetical protein